MTRNVDGQVSGVFLLPFHTLLSKVLFFQRVSGVGVDTYGNSGVVRGYFCVKKKMRAGEGYQYFLEQLLLHLICVGQQLFKAIICCDRMITEWRELGVTVQ